MNGALLTTSPWMTATEAAAYLKRGKRFVLRAIRDGRLRAARVGGRREVLTRVEWLDQFIEDQAAPVMVVPERRRA